MSYYVGIKRQTEKTLCDILNNELKPTIESRTCELIEYAPLSDSDKTILEGLRDAVEKGQTPKKVKNYLTENWLKKIENDYHGKGGWFLREIDLEFFPSKGDSERETPFGVVHVESAKPTLGGRDPRGYLCDVRIIFVSHIDEIDSKEHSEAISKVEDILSKIPNKSNVAHGYDMDNTHITINGMFISDMQTASQEQSHGDVFFCIVGVSKCVG